MEKEAARTGAPFDRNDHAHLASFLKNMKVHADECWRDWKTFLGDGSGSQSTLGQRREDESQEDADRRAAFIQEAPMFDAAIRESTAAIYQQDPAKQAQSMANAMFSVSRLNLRREKFNI